jgi:hypothetical protein
MEGRPESDTLAGQNAPADAGRKLPEGEQRAGSSRASCPLTRSRVALLIVLLNTAFFYHGCDRNNTYFSLGAPAPFLEVAVEGDASLPSQIIGGSLFWFGADLVLLVLLFVAVCRYCPSLSRIASSRTFLVAASLAVASLNSFLVSPDVWRNVVWSPTLNLQEAVQWFFLGDVTKDPASNQIDVIVASRLYFFGLLVAGYLIIRVLAFLLRRYFLVEPQRWWQFRLGGLMAASVIVGTAIGLAIRLMMRAE